MRMLRLVIPVVLALSACKKEPKQAPQNDEPVPASTPSTDAPTHKDHAPVAPTAVENTVWVDPGAPTPVAVTKAVAVMHPTEGSKVSGTVEFVAGEKGLTATAKIAGLPEGKHAYHVHLLGDCTGPKGKTAGTHFHFVGSSKEPGHVTYITGDLGDLEAGADGNASGAKDLAKASLQGPYSIVGRAVIIHEKPNDPKSPPIGAAGGRLACGVIGLRE